MCTCAVNVEHQGDQQATTGLVCCRSHSLSYRCVKPAFSMARGSSYEQAKQWCADNVPECKKPLCEVFPDHKNCAQPTRSNCNSWWPDKLGKDIGYSEYCPAPAGAPPPVPLSSPTAGVTPPPGHVNFWCKSRNG